MAIDVHQLQSVRVVPCSGMLDHAPAKVLAGVLCKAYTVSHARSIGSGHLNLPVACNQLDLQQNLTKHQPPGSSNQQMPLSLTLAMCSSIARPGRAIEGTTCLPP